MSNSELSIFAPNVGYDELPVHGDVAQLTSVPFAEALSMVSRRCYGRSRDQRTRKLHARCRFHDDEQAGKFAPTPVPEFGREREAGSSRMHRGINTRSLVVADIWCENRKLPIIENVFTR